MKIVALGCSFTEKYKGGGNPWPDIIAEKTGHDVINYGLASSANRYAYTRLLHHLMYREKIDKVYWLMTEFHRIDMHKFGIAPLDHEQYPDYFKFSYKMLSDTMNSSDLEIAKNQFLGELKARQVLANTPISYWIDDTIMIIHHVQELCKAYGIELKIIQALKPMNSYFYKCTEKEICKAILSSKYSNLLDHSSIVGYPWMKIAGGFNIIEIDNWDEKYAISENDPHPNQEGHRLIADMFIKNG